MTTPRSIFSVRGCEFSAAAFLHFGFFLPFLPFAFSTTELLIQSGNNFGICNSHVEAVNHKTLKD